MVNLRKDGPDLWEQLLRQVLELGIDEIHLATPCEQTRIAVRAGGGQLTPLKAVEKSAALAIGNHLKQVAGLVVSDRPLFQVGDFTTRLAERSIKVNVASVATCNDSRAYIGDLVKISLEVADGQPA